MSPSPNSATEPHPLPLLVHQALETRSVTVRGDTTKIPLNPAQAQLAATSRNLPCPHATSRHLALSRNLTLSHAVSRRLTPSHAVSPSF